MALVGTICFLWLLGLCWPQLGTHQKSQLKELQPRPPAAGRQWGWSSRTLPPHCHPGKAQPQPSDHLGVLSTPFPGWAVPKTSNSQPLPGEISACRQPAVPTQGHGSARQPILVCSALQGPVLVPEASLESRAARSGQGPASLRCWGATESLGSPRQVAAGRKALVRGTHSRGAGPITVQAPDLAALLASPRGARCRKRQQKYLAHSGFLPQRQSYARWGDAVPPPSDTVWPPGRSPAPRRLSWGARCTEQTTSTRHGHAWPHPAAAPPVAHSPPGALLPADPLHGKPSLNKSGESLPLGQGALSVHHPPTHTWGPAGQG